MSGWLYHPHEVRLVGDLEAQGQELFRHWTSQGWKVGWVEHRPDQELEKPVGEVCWKLDGQAFHWMARGYPDRLLQRIALLECDAVLVRSTLQSGSPALQRLEDADDPLEAEVWALWGGVRPRRVPPGGLEWMESGEIEEVGALALDRLRGRAGQVVAVVGEAARCEVPLLRDFGIEVLGPVGQWLEPGALRRSCPGCALLELREPQGRERLERLCAAREPLFDATAFRSAQSHLPQAGVVLWEPKGLMRLELFQAAGLECPTVALVHSRLKLVAPD